MNLIEDPRYYYMVYTIVAVVYLGYTVSLARRSRAVMDRIAALERTPGG